MSARRRAATVSRNHVPNRADGCLATVGEAAISQPAEPLRRSLARIGAGPILGVEGAEPLASPCVLPRVGWLVHLTVAQASLAATLKTLPARRLRRRWAGPSRQAPRPLCRQPHRRRGRTADPSLRGVGGALPLGPVSTLPVPLGNPRSSILGHPTARTIPETPRKSPETASEPVAERCGTRGQVSMPASRPSRYRAQSSMSRRRRSNRSVRRYAASMGLRTLCASAASATSRG